MGKIHSWGNQETGKAKGSGWRVVGDKMSLGQTVESFEC